MKILVFGETGQLSRSLYETAEKSLDVCFLGRHEADFESKESVLRALEAYKPNIVINTVAYTAVDRAEDDKLSCYRINTETPGFIAKWCRLHDAILIHYSTDFVFDGKKDGEYVETDFTAPLNVYGMSKRDSENLILSENKFSYIIRTSWVYNENGNNFLNTMIRLKEKESLRIVRDQRGSPTYALDLANATWKILTHKRFLNEFGIYHCTGAGITTWYDFAKKIFETANIKNKPVLIPILAQEYGARANRPENSVLSNSKIKEVFNIEMPNWENSLQLCISKKVGSHATKI